MLSELATNALRHGLGEVVVRVELEHGARDDLAEAVADTYVASSLSTSSASSVSGRRIAGRRGSRATDPAHPPRCAIAREQLPSAWSCRSSARTSSGRCGVGGVGHEADHSRRCNGAKR